MIRHMPARICPHCKVNSNFNQVWQSTFRPPSDPWHPPLIRFCEVCDNCGMPVCGATMEGNDPEDSSAAARWPRIEGVDFPDVPSGIAEVAKEAHLALNASAVRASVAMARAAVEATAKERGFTKGTLETKIKKLAEAGHISETMTIAAHEIRFAGNEVAHGDLIEEVIGYDDAREIVDLMDTILDRIYREPAKVARVRASREARHKKISTDQITADEAGVAGKTENE